MRGWNPKKTQSQENSAPIHQPFPAGFHRVPEGVMLKTKSCSRELREILSKDPRFSTNCTSVVLQRLRVRQEG